MRSEGPAHTELRPLVTALRASLVIPALTPPLRTGLFLVAASRLAYGLMKAAKKIDLNILTPLRG